jgi:uncharacterized protein
LFSKKNNFFLIIFLTTLFFIKTEVTATKLLISVNKNIHLIVDLASTEKEKRRGLMFVEELKNTNGMLFIYEKLKVRKMWMKNTKIDLDIIFINENNSISSIKKGFRLSKKIISSDVPVLAILEIPSSCNKKIMLKNGDKIQWKRINDLTNLSPSLFPCVR